MCGFPASHTSIQARLKQGMEYSEFRDRLEGSTTKLGPVANDISLTQVNPENAEPNTVWKIDTSEEDNEVLEQELLARFRDGAGRTLFVTHTISYEPPKLLKTATGESQDDAADQAETPAADEPAASAPEVASHPEASQPRLNAESDPDDPDANLQGDGSMAGGAILSGSRLTFDERVTRSTLRESITEAAKKLGSEPPFRLRGPQGQSDSAAGFRVWNIEATTTPEHLGEILAEMRAALESKPAWLSSNQIGGKVAGDMQNKALAAILISMVCIVGYIWVRFQRVIFGISAVVALVHDVLIMLGAIAVSLWLSKVLGLLLIEEFKISLSVVAAFLTIIGYSLNDTIVTFDRIREVRGRSPDITEEMIDISINQTLSRTVLTALTTLLVVVILYIFGGQEIHGFAFALLIGVVVGTYSSVYIAAPALLWMSQPHKKSSRESRSKTQAVQS